MSGASMTGTSAASREEPASSEAPAGDRNGSHAPVVRAQVWTGSRRRAEAPTAARPRLRSI
jgi:hypothetical protein